ncbi:MAG: aminomethyl-transferring glycine dehydrogenase [Hamadaea sp.]|uniref:aminomethyl-transferring glycine dehydrogenase n=1 Tax=Hamadaea sp. TaxID=2024425 RepID=UPI0017B87897|nr:aminomethyl-transferring glycine dehydrogenase [Hamadaea sp.]NUR74013.1 aminomethyl-transferring glycine dehydrogenase [Hamadaea sp.]NUT21188.1 aminomethyl-transferring glycine dehydrogenase [Hamadaea sp.]
MTSPFSFSARHIGPTSDDARRMLESVGYSSLDELMDAAIPEAIRWHEQLDLPAAATEAEVLGELRELASRNQVLTSMIGLGYYGTHTPGVIKRNVLENPAWYTAYTPYQPEISQGRLEALLNFQTVVTDLTGLATANASMLDEATAAAEAMTLARRSSKSKSNVYAVDADSLPQSVDVIRTRAEPLGIEVRVVDLEQELDFEYFGLHLQYPGASGAVRDHAALIEAAHAQGALVTVAADLLALVLLREPGAIGADIACGTAQRFGVPMGFGGPHAGYLAVRAGLERSLPGRLVGVSRDADGNRAYRLALQTREQHIRREKATSNICTAQVLLAVMASMYAVYHGPNGLRAIAQHAHDSATLLAAGLRDGGVQLATEQFFDTVTAVVPGRAAEVVAAAAEQGVNLWAFDSDRIAIACDETTTAADIAAVWAAFGVAGVSEVDASAVAFERTSDFLTHPVFRTHHSETAMLRYLRRLADLDYALDRGMIPLGSCTMKLNATTEMEAVTWPEFANVHPFAPAAQTAGYAELIESLESWLAELTGYDAVSVQPNAGSQGELAGLLAIRAYHRSRGDDDRDVCLIPSSAHGTNAASAVMAGMRVVVVACDENGNVDLVDLDRKLAEHAERLAAIMVTYPSTHGVYETGIAELCAKVHEAGGQVYVDGANLNALVGFAKPGKFGADVSHLNLHKTFCIPHGGGGPGVGPVAVRAHLAEFLPGRGERSVAAISAAPHGSAGILPIPWAYVRMMGPDGLASATAHAVLAANYVAAKLRDHYPVLYAGNKGLVAHECILDLRPLSKATGVSVDDVAKRLIDYGFHAPTMSFPVAGTLMVEPTESEDLGELDRFVEAMIAIRREIDAVAEGVWPKDDNPLVNAPHTAAMVSGDEWAHAYPRSMAAYPGGMDPVGKYWAPVRRIDGAYGDRNLVCSCPPPEAFA